MSKTYSGKQIIKSLQKLGFKIVGQRGSHIKLRKNKSTVIVPNHRELAYGTFQNICKQADISRNELIEHI